MLSREAQVSSSVYSIYHTVCYTVFLKNRHVKRKYEQKMNEQGLINHCHKRTMSDQQLIKLGNFSLFT